MSRIIPNPEQKRVIETLEGDVVVRAGAGSGKTRTLAQRFAFALTEADGRPGAEIDSILTITFTNKAAGELLSRVRAVLAEEGSIDKARRLDEAWVSTIDSFCSRLLRRYALEADVDPSFSVAGDVQTAALEDVAFGEATAAASKDAGGAALLAAYGPECLRYAIVAGLSRLRSMGRSPQDIECATETSLDHVIARLDKLFVEYRADVQERAAPSSTQHKNLEKMAAIEGALRGSDSRDSAWAEAALEALPAGKVSRQAEPKELAGQIQEALEELKGALVDEVTRPFGDAFKSLVSSYEVAYSEAKRTRGLLDFGDLVEDVRSLFAENPRIAREVAERFSLLMVDEFQDTNRAQLQTLDPIRRENLCVVGDDQQSIYGFRYADVKLFEEMMRRVKTCPMSTNYRSHKAVLAFTNALFAQECFFGDGLQRLSPGRQEPADAEWPGTEPRVEVVITDAEARTDLNAREATALAVADKVERLIDTGVPAADIVILMRSLRQASVYLNALRQRGIEALTASGEAFYESPEVADVRALLKAIVVPGDDAALARVLAGPIVGLSPDLLFELSAGDFPCLWEAAKGVPQGEGRNDANRGDNEWGTLATAVESIVELRGEYEYVTVSELILLACEAFDYDLTLLSSGPSGRRAWGNVLKLSRMAAELEEVGALDAGSFLTYLDSHEEIVTNEPSAVVSSGDDCVRLMSVHAAKGLQFPVVVVADLGRGLTMGDTSHFLIDEVDGRVRLGVKCPADGSVTEGMRGAEYVELAEHAKAKEIAEEKRIFYVACTRAEEALILAGDAKISDPADSCIAGLILRALGAPQHSATVALPDGPEIPVRIERPDEWTPVQKDAPVSATRHEETEAVLEALKGFDAEEDCRPLAPDARMPASVSYSSLHLFGQCPQAFIARYVWGLGRIVDPSAGSALGSAVHAILEAAPDLRPQGHCVDTVGEAFGLDKAERARARVAGQAFADSQIAAQVRSAERYQREVSFGVDLGATRLEGKMDLLCWNGSEALIVDYKTGLNPAASDSDSRMAAYRLQADCYALAAFAGGATKVVVSFAFVEQGVRLESFAYNLHDEGEIREDLGVRIERIEAAIAGEEAGRTVGEWCSECPAAAILSCSRVG